MLFVCVCVHVCACPCVCVSAHVCPCMCISVCVCVCVCVCVSMHVCVCTFAEGAALSRYLDGVLAALFAGHGGAVGVPVHTLTEGAVVLLPLLLVLT